MRHGRVMVAGAVFGVGFGGLVDGILLHQVLRWHNFLADDVTTATVDGLNRNTRADGVFHVTVLLVSVLGVALLTRAAGAADTGVGREAVGASLIGWGAFNVVDAVVFHFTLDLHHIRMVDDHLVYDVAFAVLGIVLLVGGMLLTRLTSGGRPRPA